ncbi:MAG: membrane protein insertion efficiency factor YidD [Deltaproteobacteria bacterium]|nr:membrane protein insertion efficiency factor YidD [Deltaproteobacteria bacterium]
MVATLAMSLVLAAATPFGPWGNARHPAVGPRAAVPGNGPEPVVSQAPEEVPLSKVNRGARDTRGRGGGNPLYLLFLVYKNYLTHVDGNRCQHYPTCSAYGAQAVGRYNVLGVFMAMDRLWASGNSSTVRSNRLVYGVGPAPRFYDPLEDSAFFFTYPWVAWLGPPIPTVDRAMGRTVDAPEPAPDTPTPP